jgi:hypothetical protein
MVGALEAAPDDIGGSAGSLRYANFHALGHVLFRVSPDKAHSLRGRLEEIWRKRKAIDPGSFATKGLDILLHGATGYERSGPRVGAGGSLNPRFCALVRDDPDFVTNTVLGTPVPPDARFHAELAFAGSEKVVKRFADSWRVLAAPEAQAFFVHTFGEVRSPHVERAMTEMSTTSRATKEAREWLAGHRAARKR